MQATGFGDGLYTEDELNAKEIKDKEAKVSFLDKLVALVQYAAGEEIPVKSSKIVAGQEPEATNIFLQYLFKVATSGIDSTPIVAQILGEGGDDGGQQQDDEEDEEAAAAEAAAAAAEEEARKAAEEEQRKKDKRNQKKKQMEEEKFKQQQEEENKQKAKAEAERKAQEKKDAEEAAAKAKTTKKAPPKKVEEPPAKPAKKNAIIEEGQDDGENEENIIVDEEDNGMNAGIDINDVDPESKFGKKAMAQLRAQEEEEEADRNLNDDNATGGVKMGKIRRGNRKKAGGVERSEPQKKKYSKQLKIYHKEHLEDMERKILNI